jgi:hypothetical protein
VPTRRPPAYAAPEVEAARRAYRTALETAQRAAAYADAAYADARPAPRGGDERRAAAGARRYARTAAAEAAAAYGYYSRALSRAGYRGGNR